MWGFQFRTRCSKSQDLDLHGSSPKNSISRVHETLSAPVSRSTLVMIFDFRARCQSQGWKEWTKEVKDGEGMEKFGDDSPKGKRKKEEKNRYQISRDLEVSGVLISRRSVCFRFPDVGLSNGGTVSENGLMNEQHQVKPGSRCLQSLQKYFIYNLPSQIFAVSLQHRDRSPTGAKHVHIPETPWGLAYYGGASFRCGSLCGL